MPGVAGSIARVSHQLARVRRSKWPRAGVATATALALLVTLHGQAASAAPPAKDEAWKPKKEKSVHGTNAPVIPRKTDAAQQQALAKTPTVVWPTAGTAEVSPPNAWNAPLIGSVATARPGGLPVRVGATAAAKAAVPSKLRVESIGRRGDAAVFRLLRTDGAKQASPVSIGVDYSSFQHAYGGDWNSRLQLVRLPECALTTPTLAACKGVPLATRNDASGQLSAEGSVASTGGLYAVQAAASGAAGDFKTSSLSPSATWQAGGPSGDFNWSYPMDVPPGIGGPTVDLALEYSSGSVDGRTSATNNQPSWVGEGFEFAPGGSIERRYAGCGSESEKTGNNGKTLTGDLCWATDNATVTLNGKGGELVRDDATGTWRSRGDDGTTVQRLTGAPNGDNNGEYWVLTTQDGTKYYFGMNRLTGWASGNQETKSTWTVPVFGNHSGEPCNASSFSSSYCQQAYRWNLDYVVDRHGNTMSLYYDVETNNYARQVSASKVSTYTRAGNLARIEYGQRDGAVYTSPAVGRIRFVTADRCLPGTTCTTSQPANYPDTPLDRQCTSSSNCDNKFNPTFWTQKRLASVVTEVWRGSAYAAVDSWTLRHTFPNPGDGSRAGLWLEGVTNAGHVGGAAALPEVNFDGIQLPNRVAGIDGIPTMNWWRISAVHYGTGGELAVGYSVPDCAAPGNLPAVDRNGNRCHPAKWTPDGGAERQDWFNKFVVTDVTESDRVSGLEPVVTKIAYLSPPAWRYDEEDGLIEIGKKTWAQWRGYDRVRITKGHPSGQQSVVEHRYFRGMDGDKLAAGGQKDVYVTDSTGAQVEDLDPLSGQLRETTTYHGTTVVDRSITDHWVSAPTATRVRSWGTTRAYQVEDSATRQDEATDTGFRKSATRNTYDTTGAVTETVDWNDLADAGDDTCTRYTYAANAAAGLRELPIREHTVSVACDKPWTSADVIEDERTTYDDSATPTKGDVTKVEELAGFDGAGTPQYKTAYTAAYDAVGRPTRATDAMGRASTMAYTPAAGGPVTRRTVTQPNGHVSVEDLEPAWGEEVAVTGPDGRRKEIAYDPLGRTSKVWMPGQPRTGTPNLAYEYLLRADAPGVVKTTSLQADNSLETTIELTDGLLRPRQVQEPAPGGGRTVTDYVYDSRGQQVKENGPYYNSAALSDQVLIPREEELPIQKVTSYDGADRPTTEVVKSRNTEKWRTSYTMSADRYTIQPPSGEQPITRILDVQGRLQEIRQYSGTTATGAYDSTTYTYHRSGRLATVTDPAGNRWSFGYDLRGRKISETDPDKGTSTFTYDDSGLLLSGTDGRGVTLAYSYDQLGRRTAVHEGSLQGPKRADWTYDTLAAGSPSSATRYVNGQAYVSRITGYDAGGRALGVEVTLPASEGALAGTYAVRNTYNADGETATSELPGVGGLPAETLRYGYNGQDMPTTLTGATTYVTGTSYTPYGEPETTTLSQNNGKWVQQLREYETGTRRLSRVVTERETLPQRISSVSYGYDPAGNIRRIADAPSAASGEATDTQCFDYDQLRRLTAAWTPASGDCAAAPTAAGLGGPAPYWQSWTFDKVGNRQSETKHGLGGATTSSYEYPAVGQPRPHALQKVTAGGTASTYDYDAVGNLTKRTQAGVDETFTWDAEGHLEKVVKAGQTTSFVYDADGTRLLRRDTSGTTFYFGQTELLLEPSGTVTGTRYYQHGEQTVAVRVGGNLSWLGSDHHGTPDLAIDAGTQSFQRRRSTPYGEARGAAPTNWPGQKGFVGGPIDASTALVHLQAREYDPSTGRFISVDPIADYQDAQQLNGYSYANNSPVTYSDPDGQLFWIPLIILAIRLIPVVVRVVQVVATTVRVVTPVVRAVSSSWTSVVAGISRLIQTVRNITTWVVRLKTVIKRLVTTKKTVQKVITRTVKKVPAPRAVAKKPPSVAKQAAKPAARNAPSPKPPPRKPPVGRTPGAKTPMTKKQYQADKASRPPVKPPRGENPAPPPPRKPNYDDFKWGGPDQTDWHTGTYMDQARDEQLFKKEEDWRWRGHQVGGYEGKRYWPDGRLSDHATPGSKAKFFVAIFIDLLKTIVGTGH
ncbi:RHS repeat-associated core domain-containing protein [Kribbella sp. NPDC056861]|uniref:RHS repeat-associated core domain-containing protein n=1 Tax=Kribbella sp. NPDC056861 TaxID=3154857 RepID=UPI0034491CA9